MSNITYALFKGLLPKKDWRQRSRSTIRSQESTRCLLSGTKAGQAQSTQRSLRPAHSSPSPRGDISYRVARQRSVLSQPAVSTAAAAAAGRPWEQRPMSVRRTETALFPAPPAASPAPEGELSVPLEHHTPPEGELSVPLEHHTPAEGELSPWSRGRRRRGSLSSGSSRREVGLRCPFDVARLVRDAGP